MKKFKFIRLEDPIYKSFIVLSYGNSDKYVDFMNKVYGRDFTDDDLSHTEARTSTGNRLSNKNFEYIIWLRDKKNIGALTHEASHLTAMLFYDRGIKLDPNNDEPFCYFVEYVAKKFLEL